MKIPQRCAVTCHGRVKTKMCAIKTQIFFLKNDKYLAGDSNGTESLLRNF